MPSRQLNVNRLGLELVGLAADLLAWIAILLGGELASAEPNKLRYQLHAAA